MSHLSLILQSLPRATKLIAMTWAFLGLVPCSLAANTAESASGLSPAHAASQAVDGATTVAQTSQSIRLDQARLNYAKKVIEQYGAHIPPDIQSAILSQQIILGMPPYEASLAAGRSTYEVEPDPEQWPPNADPNAVIAAQSMHPDKSKIRCIFENETQYPGDGRVKFRVTFRNGRAIKIERLLEQ